MDRVIIHSDMNSCYASIECSLNPELRGKAVAVGGSTEDRHGIILAKSEEAKKCGVKTGEVIWQAKQKCPDLIIIPPHFEQYMKYSSLAHDIYSRYTDKIEPMGLDEVWCDISGSIKAFGGAKKICDEIREAFKNELGLTVSIGLSYNKIFAKLGSDLAGRDEVFEISRENYKEKVHPLPVRVLFGIGPKTGDKLNSYGINTVGQLAACSSEWLRLIFGVLGEDMWQKANGLDFSRVMSDGQKIPIKSIGHGITCTADLVDSNEVWKVMLSLSQNVSKRLREAHLEATAVQIAVKDNQLVTRQFQGSTPYVTQSAGEIAKTALDLFQKNYLWNYDVRSVTVTAINLQSENSPVQLELTGDYKRHEKQKILDDTVMELRQRFGEKAIFNCCLMTETKMPEHKEKVPLPFMRYR
ncbi:MAG: DNA polymerase IV [Clostridia bacterium]|nr:DNA polymerase IV [Clostridia bacterium]